jgi:hypothetical protein
MILSQSVKLCFELAKNNRCNYNRTFTYFNFVDTEKSGKLNFSKMKSNIHFPNLVP